ncbi:ceramidase domain-containing protein [Roseicyclus persicicus]|uniref:Ceramidase n=1 Tax=Roseicyclus persicicus TaxID=2650661 RepID=A0A7X6GY47_9RHOB|nr:ceramidase domain-containing protein [Roseibacterium persicicum]NKX44556.1 hypothetical protein [Roseibacterium persicicum]
MDWTTPIDAYCERLGPGLWAEPVNALTNAAFLVAALAGAVAALRAGLRDRALWVLIALAAAIGVGSFLFHSFATPWAALADVTPIWAFVALYLYSFGTQVAGVRPLRLVFGTALGLVALIAAMAGLDAALDGAAAVLNGSEHYAPALLAMLVFSVLLHRRHHPLAPLVAAATATFALSLTFRTLDAPLCPALPLGTHFLWHLLNATVIGLLLIALVRGLRPGR